jgi:hypothetical protein
MNRKIMALTLLTAVAFAAVIGGYMMTVQANDANSTTTATDATGIPTLCGNVTDMLPFGGMMMGGQGFGGGSGGHGRGGMGGMEGMGSMGNIEVSSEYTATVNSILSNDTDIQNLINEGYNVTSINPIVKTTIGADGTITTKASTAIVTLQNGTSGYATAKVDIEQAKVTQIVILTRTVIDKTSS